jgi:hypothetical protein
VPNQKLFALTTAGIEDPEACLLALAPVSSHNMPTRSWLIPTGSVFWKFTPKTIWAQADIRIAC